MPLRDISSITMIKTITYSFEVCPKNTFFFNGCTSKVPPKGQSSSRYKFRSLILIYSTI